MRTFYADLLRSGRSANGTVYAESALDSLLPQVAGTPVRAYGGSQHAKDVGLTPAGRAKATRQVIGFLGEGARKTRLADGTSVVRVAVHVNDPQIERLLDIPGAQMGLSIDAIGLVTPDESGRQVCAALAELHEATLVARPAAARCFAVEAAKNSALGLVRTFVGRGKMSEALLLLGAIGESLEAGERTALTALLTPQDLPTLRSIAEHLAAKREKEAMAVLSTLEDEVRQRGLTSDPPPLDPMDGPSMTIGEAWDAAAAALEALQSQARLSCHRIGSSDWSRYQASKQVATLTKQAKRARNLARAARAVERAREWAATCPEHRVQEAVAGLRLAEATYQAEKRAC